MRVVSVTCFRNESDVLEAFIRHTARFCDEHVLLNHGSTDSCAEIIRQLQREGWPLRVIEDPTLGNLEIEQCNRLLRVAADELSADWILFLDDDEFIRGARDKSFLPEPVDNETPCIKLALQTYCPQADDPAALLNPVERITHRLANEPFGTDSPWRYKVAVPGWLARKKGGFVAEGKHYYLVDAVEAPRVISNDVCLAHFSLRSPVQHAIKIVSRQLQKFRHISNTGSELGFYDKPYKILRESYAGFVKQFYSMGVSYMRADALASFVKDPVPYLGGPLRHTPPTPDTDSLVRDLLDLSERLARTSADDVAPAAADTDTPAEVAIELSSHPDPAYRRMVTVQPDRTQFQTAVFPLDCPPGTTAFRLKWRSAPGMIELARITLTCDGTRPSPQVLEGARLRSMIRVVGPAAKIASTATCRILVSTHGTVLELPDWNRGEGGKPIELAIQFRFESRITAPVFLSAMVLKEINDTADALASSQRDLEAARREIELCRAIAGHPGFPAGCVIDFSSAGSSALFKGEGWSGTEAWGTWTEGARAVLNIPLAAIPDRDLWLNATVQGFIHAKNPAITVRTSIDGEPVATWELKSATPALFHARIAAGRIKRTECKITFDILNVASPRDLGISTDPRRLGMGVVRIDFSSAAPAR